MTDADGSPLQPQAAVELLFSVLAPGLLEQAKVLENGEAKLVHYTSAENALNIIRSERFWLRNVRCMNDYSEVQHGIQLLLKVFNENDEARIKRIIEIFDGISPGAAGEAIKAFNAWIPSLPNDTYIGCLSLFRPDDAYGRLSMWRAYASGTGGVALVMNSTPFLAETDNLKAYSLPVAYLSDQQFSDGIDRCLEVLAQVVPTISVLTSEKIRDTVFWWFLCLSVSMKHPAFMEEQEWRIIYIPSMDKSPVIEESVECVSGVPQIVQKIPLIDDPENGLIQADIPNLLNRVLIGPSQYPIVLRDAFAAAIEAKGVTDAQQRITNSFIPLR